MAKPQGQVTTLLRRPVTLPLWSLLIIGCLGLGLLANLAGHGDTTGATNTTASAPSGQTTTAATTAAKPAATKQPAPTATATHVPTWTVVQTFQGNGSKKTATFSTPDDWRLLWTCNPSSSYLGSYNVIASVMNSDGTPLDFSAINTICQAGNTHDQTEEHQGGDVYLDITSEGAWTLQVEVLK